MCTFACADGHAAAALASSSDAFNAGGKVATAVLTVAGGAQFDEDGNFCGVFKADDAIASGCSLPPRSCNALEVAQRTIVRLNRELAALRAQVEEKTSGVKPSESDELRLALVENAKLRAENQKLRSISLAYFRRQQISEHSPSASLALNRNAIL